MKRFEIEGTTALQLLGFENKIDFQNKNKFYPKPNQVIQIKMGGRKIISPVIKGSVQN